MQIYKIIPKILVLFSTFLSLSLDTLSMQDAIYLMKQNNPHIKMSHERQLLALKAENNHQSRFFPKVLPFQLSYDAVNKQADLKTGSQWQLPMGSTLNLNYQQSYNKSPKVDITLEQPITHNTQSAKNSIKSLDIYITQLLEQQKYEQMILKMRQAYYQCVMDKLVLEHQQTQIEEIRKEIEKQSILYKGGEISKLELEKSLNQHEKTTIAFLKQEQTAELHLIELKKLLGIPLHNSIELDTNIHFSVKRPSANIAMAQALANNIPYQVAKLQFEKARYSYEIAKTHSLPKVSIYARGNEKQDFNAGIKVQIEIPDADTDYQDTKTLMDYHHAQQQFMDQDLALRSEVHKILISIENQAKLIDLSAKNLQLQQSIYNAESIKFKHQQISVADYQKAAVQLQVAYQESIRIQIEYSHLHDSLLHIIGDFSLIIQPENNHA